MFKSTILEISLSKNKRKIFNDPVYGFITLRFDIILDLIDHPYFQRLRRIKQLGLSHLVYPGALHTRFHHALGAMHLTGRAVDTLRSKGTDISEEEEKAVLIAILLHDIGHGPFSHSLEHTIVEGVHHELISDLFMQELNKEFNGELTLAIEVFNNRYHKKFLHQLVSSQLDMDRLDYLKRDSFYTGVTEGEVGNKRIIKMLNVHNDELVLDEKAIYSIENFIVARRFMYWQVYLHKTVVACEAMLIQTLKRAKYLASQGVDLFCSPDLHNFLYNKFTKESFNKSNEALISFSHLDDNDILCSIKVWMHHDDKVLSELSTMMINREIFKIELSKDDLTSKYDSILKSITNRFEVSEEEASYFMVNSSLVNNAYNTEKDKINLLYKDGTVKDIVAGSDNLNISAQAKAVKKYYLCYPR